MGLHIRPIEPEDIQPAAHLVARVFQHSVAPLYGADGIREFVSHVTPEAFARRLRANRLAFVAVDESGDIVGIVEVRDYCHISLLFVETEFQRKGIGRRLVTAAVEACKESRPDLVILTVNASPSSVQAYERFGFVVTGPEQEKNGIRFVPMALTVSFLSGA